MTASVISVGVVWDDGLLVSLWVIWKIHPVGKVVVVTH